MVVINPKINNTQSFGNRLHNNSYRFEYLSSSNFNGQNPDEFVLGRLQNVQPGFVYDFGAGQGRNTVPIAQLGHTVAAIEINDVGRFCINQAAKNANVEDRVRVWNLNLLDSFTAVDKADFIFMSHISQHFNLDELTKVMQNVSKNLKKGCEFVFDALVPKDVPEEETKFDIQYSQSTGAHFGVSNFEQNSILDAAKQTGLSFVEEAFFDEKGSGRARYETQSDWIKRNHLKWFVFKK